MLTGEALLRLLAAVATVRFVRFERWRETLGRCAVASYGPGHDLPEHEQDAVARLLAAHVDRAAQRLALPVKCLPRAMALGAMLGRRGIAHEIVIAVKPHGERAGADGLHAWVERSGEILIGDLPGPWIEIFRSRPV